MIDEGDQMFSAIEPNSGMDLRDLLGDLPFRDRQRISSNPNRESIALRRLARVFADRPQLVLQELVDIAVELCDADSAGISLEEKNDSGEETFRWIAVAGSFRKYLNGRTPRNYSPCGVCLDTGRPQLYRVTKPYYDFLGVTAEDIHDGILIPWSSSGLHGTLWAVSHKQGEIFSFDDYKVLQSLADFTSIALRYQQDQRALLKEENEAASTARANEMAHQINNPLQCLTNTLYLARFAGIDREAYLAQAAADLDALSELVRKLLAETRTSVRH